MVKALFLFQPLKRLLDATQLIGFSPRLLECAKIDQIRVPQASHSDQERCRVAKKLFVAASEPRVLRQFAPMPPISQISRGGRSHHLPSSRFFADQAPH
jgi:hypothetical protein